VKVLAIILGSVLLIVAARGTEVDSVSGNGDGQGFWNLVYLDASAKQIWTWTLAVVVIGLFGFIKPIQPIADGILVLMVVALLVSSKQGKDFFTQIEEFVGAPTV